MKNTGKNSRINNNTLLYILFFLLLVAAVSGIIYHFNKPKVPSLAENISWINDESGLNKNQSLSDKNIASRIENANNKKKRCNEKLYLINELTNKQRDAYESLLKSINNEVLELDEWSLMEIKDEKKQEIIYQVLKESRRLDRLEVKIDSQLTERLVKFCKQDQPEWLEKIFPNEAEEAIQRINKLFSPFFHKFREELIRNGEEKATVEEIIEPKMIGGELTTSANLQKHINFLKAQQIPVKSEATDKVKMMKPGPMEWKFLGFTDFLKENQKSEGSITLGLTECSGKFPANHKDDDKNQFFAWCCPVDGFVELQIKLRKELLFSRLGENYDRWITDLVETKNGPEYKSSDVSWETLIETIAHELAHAVIDSVKWKYESADGEGHGPLHSNYTKRMREMIENSSEYKKFEQWWKEKL